MVTGDWIVAGDLLVASGGPMAITFVLLMGLALGGVAVMSTREHRGPAATHLDVERHPTLTEAVSPPP